MLKSGLLIIRFLLNVAGSAADRSTFLSLTVLVGDRPHAHSNSNTRRSGRDDDYRFFKKKTDFESRIGTSGIRIDNVDMSNDNNEI